jgi:hypothetical protein
MWSIPHKVAAEKGNGAEAAETTRRRCGQPHRAPSGLNATFLPMSDKVPKLSVTNS